MSRKHKNFGGIIGAGALVNSKPRTSGVFNLGGLSGDNAFEEPSLDLNFDGRLSSFTRATTSPTAPKANGDQLATEIVTQSKTGTVQSKYMGPNGTLVNGYVDNLVPHSTDFSTSAGWTHGDSPSLSTGQADPFGGTSATTIGDSSITSFSHIAYNPTLGNDQVTTASIFLRKQSNTITDQVCLLRIQTGGSTTGLAELQIKPQDGSYNLVDYFGVQFAILEATREDFGDWWRFSVTGGLPANHTTSSYDYKFFPDVGTSFVSPNGGYPTTGTGAVTIFGAQFEVAGSVSQYVSSTAQVPRVEFDANGNPLGLLVEESRTNLLTKSVDLTHANWSKYNSVGVTAGQADPAGGTGAFLVEDNQNTYSHIRQDVTGATAGATYTASIFVKKTAAAASELLLRFKGFGETNADVRLDTYTGQIAGGSNIDVQDYNGWWRISTTTTLGSATQLLFVVYPAIASSFNGGDAGSAQTTAGTHIVYGPQIEQGEGATSYIPTDATTLQRSADDITMATSSFGFDINNSTVLVDATLQSETATGSYPRIWELSGSSTQRLFYRVFGGNTQLVFDDSGNDTLTIDAVSSYPYAAKFASAHVFSGGSTVASTALNGVVTSQSVTSTGTGSYTQLSLGGPTSATTNYQTTNRSNGHIRRFTYWPRAISDASLVAYTGTNRPTELVARTIRRWGGMAGRSLVSGGNVETTGVLSLAEHYQSKL